MMFDLTDKVAVITGSTKGIGKAIAQDMAKAGARVVVSSRKADACDAVVEEIRQAGGTAIAQPCNISHKEQLQALVDRTIAEWGRIDVLVCNAAVNPYFGPSTGISDEAFEKVLHNNILSNHWLCNMVIPDMAERGEGSVIIISSIGGLKGTGLLGAYAVSKAADMQLVRNLAVEWGPKNVRVNAIAPGLVRTDFARALWENPEIYKQAVAGYPLRRIGEPEEISGAAVFLASKAASFLTGQTIVVDGGVTIAGG
jgi:NAD(P)-dependent dehydrogenase (short-subunit alcohol dehydrogenase family)